MSKVLVIGAGAAGSMAAIFETKLQYLRKTQKPVRRYILREKGVAILLMQSVMRNL